MEKFENSNNGEDFKILDPSYEEIGTFSGKDADMASVIGVKNSVIQTIMSKETDESFIRSGMHGHKVINKIRVKLYGDDNRITNNLILDNVGEKYSYIKYTASFDNEKFDPNFNSAGVTTKVFTKEQNKILEMSLDKKNNENNVDSNYSDRKNEFKLSQVMRNIGDISKLIKSNKNEKANIIIKQRAFIICRCGRWYVIFNFNLSNVGNNVAQKILFKDVFSTNLYISKENVFLDGIRIKNKDIFLKKNKLVIDVYDIKPGNECDITIIAQICDFRRITNFGIISYVSNSYKVGNNTVTNISQKLSNVKKQRKF